MGQGIKRPQRDYAMAFKLALVEQVKKGEMSYREVQERYCEDNQINQLTINGNSNKIQISG